MLKQNIDRHENFPDSTTRKFNFLSDAEADREGKRVSASDSRLSKQRMCFSEPDARFEVARCYFLALVLALILPLMARTRDAKREVLRAAVFQ
jgi:hypothetical protein